ncbi:hypothetical protein D9756_007658 [Leucocoprinus leucothites]|uniref:Uncharacterized protein n=1 Tax=Leucocoprinus leucothites TaxID=201217 RepID=A0A8H5D183_9AGAR|nr:hypothetical protein D9756_007658 [Leucoagaricus leucothites]
MISFSLFVAVLFKMVSFRVSASHNALDELAYRDPFSHDYFPTTMLPGCTPSPRASAATLHAQLAFAGRQIFILNTENVLLRKECENLRLMINVFLAEIAILHDILESTKDDSNISCVARADRDTVSRLEKQMTDYRRFIRALAEGNILDPRIINHAQAGVDNGLDPETMLVEAIQTAASDKESPWSKILPALLNNPTLEKHATTAHSYLKSPKDHHEIERAAYFWKMQAAPKPNGSTTAITQSSHNTGDHGGNSATLKHPLFLPTSTLDDLSDSEGLQINGAFKSPNSHKLVSSSIPISLDLITNISSKGKGGNRQSPRPSSEGLSHHATRSHQYHRLTTKRLRRTTVHDSLDFETQAIEKRHGFLMPRIQTFVLEKHARAPAETESSPICPAPNRLENSADVSAFALPLNPSARRSADITSIPGTQSGIKILSLRSLCALQSAERLCATFSSGSFGSLEMTVMSGSNRNLVGDPSICNTHAPEASSYTHQRPISSCSGPIINGHEKKDSPSQVETEIINSHAKQQSNFDINAGTPMDKICYIDMTMGSRTPLPRHKVVGEDLLFEVPTRAAKKPHKENDTTLPSTRSTMRASYPSISQATQRTTRLCHNTIPARPLQAETVHLCTPASKRGGFVKVVPPVKLDGSRTTRENKREVTRSSNRLVSPVRAPASAICIPKPRLSFVKYGLARPTASARPVSSATGLTAMLPPQVTQRAGYSSLSNSPSQARLFNDKLVETRILTSASHEDNLIPKPRNRLRVVNTACGSELGKPLGQVITHPRTQPQAKLWSSIATTERSERLGDRNKKRCSPTISSAGLIGGVDRVRYSHIREAPSS